MKSYQFTRNVYLSTNQKPNQIKHTSDAIVSKDNQQNIAFISRKCSQCGLEFCVLSLVCFRKKKNLYDKCRTYHVHSSQVQKNRQSYVRTSLQCATITTLSVLVYTY